VPSAILEAVYRGDSDALDSALDGKPDLDAFEAAALGRELRLRELVDANPALTRAFSDDGWSALHLAAFFPDDLTCVRLLIDRGADVNSVSANDMAVTPLGSAAARSRGDVVRILLEAGAHPDRAQTGGYTPLHAAAAGGDDDIVGELLSHGADAGARTGDGRTPADLATEAGHADLAKRLRDAEPDHEEDDG
jgi:ankyrin repeat protein